MNHMNEIGSKDSKLMEIFDAHTSFNATFCDLSSFSHSIAPK